MAKTIYLTASSLDGFIADPDHSLQWLFDADTGGGDHGFSAFLDRVGAVCMGRSTYEWILRVDGMLEDRERWVKEWRGLPIWVFTHADVPLLPGVRVVSGDVRPVHAAMRNAAGERDIWCVGGGELAGRFADAGLLDELCVQIAPVLLGEGKPLLPRRIESDRLRPVDVDRSGPFAVLTYRLEASDGPQS